MTAEEIKATLCENIADGTKVWAFIRNGDQIGRINIGFNALEVLGMASLATNEICQLLAGDKSLAPTPTERKFHSDDDKETKSAN